MVDIIEKKIVAFKEFLKRNPLLGIEEESPTQVAKSRLTVQQLENGKVYKRKKVKLKDAIKVA